MTATVAGAHSLTFIVDSSTTTMSGPAVAVPAGATVLVTADQNGTGQAQFCFTSATPGDVLIRAGASGTNTQSNPTKTATKTFVEARLTD